jgi:hypothetical protein
VAEIAVEQPVNDFLPLSPKIAADGRDDIFLPIVSLPTEAAVAAVMTALLADAAATMIRTVGRSDV